MANDDSCGPAGGSPAAGAPRELLAEGRFAAVERCACGAIYLHLGPISVRLDGAALPELREVIDRAARRQRLAAGAEAVPGRGRPEPMQESSQEGQDPDGELATGQSPPNRPN